MRRKIKYLDRILETEPYPIKIEKDLLFYSLDENPEIDDVLYILEPYINLKINSKKADIYKLSLHEKLFLCFYLREISVTDTLRFKFLCDGEIEDKKCDHPIDSDISISSIFKPSTFDPELLKKYKIKDIISDNINDYFTQDPSNLDTEEYDHICDYIMKNCAKFDFVRTLKCRKCGKEHKISFFSVDNLCKSFSEINIASFYKLTNQLIYKGHYDLNSILNFMYPYEREIYIDNLNNEIEEINKQTKSLMLKK